jgi:chromate reductase
MSEYNIAVVVGSLRRESFNRQMANGLATLFTPQFSLRQLEIGDLRFVTRTMIRTSQRPPSA